MASARIEDEDGITSINITPLVDVFLVLLILVMIFSSLLDHREIRVSVPKAAHGGDMESKAPKTSGLAMDFERRIYLDGEETDSARVTATLRDEASKDPAHQVLIAADQRLLYEDVVRLLDWVKGSGVRKYALKISNRAAAASKDGIFVMEEEIPRPPPEPPPPPPPDPEPPSKVEPEVLPPPRFGLEATHWAMPGIWPWPPEIPS